MAEYHVYFDGGCRNNGTPSSISGIGVAVFLQNEFLPEYSFGVRLRDGLNSNEAEYKALQYALKKAAELKSKGHYVKLFGDSNLVVTQFNLEWKVGEQLYPYWKTVKDLGESLGITRLKHVLRRYNCRADELANKAMNF